MPISGPNEEAGLKKGKIIFINCQADNQVRLGTNRKFPNLEPPEPSIIEPRTTRTYVQNLFPNLEPSIPNLEPLNGRAGSKIRHTDHGF